MKRILLLGDSIRLGYQESVRKYLGNDFDCRFPKDNCRFAKYMLNELDRIFKECCPEDGKADLIHFNCGLWDSAIVCREDGMFTEENEYEKYMRILIRELRKHTNKLVFASTTPVKPGSANQKIEFVRRLNARILPVMAQEKIPVNDLYTFVIEQDPEKMICGDCIHLSDEGRDAVGRKTADMIRSFF